MKPKSFTLLLKNHSLLNEQTLGELEATTIEHPWFQLGWMLYLKNLKVVGSEQFYPVLKKVAVIVSDREVLYRFLNLNSSEIDSANLPEEVNEKENLIEQFLKTGPAKIRVKQAENGTSPEELNKGIIQKADIENDALVTETLAQIYEDQKNYRKAISAYEKLSLKYPEKSVYFASRIKDIEKIKE